MFALINLVNIYDVIHVDYFIHVTKIFNAQRHR